MRVRALFGVTPDVRWFRRKPERSATNENALVVSKGRITDGYSFDGFEVAYMRFLLKRHALETIS